MFTRLQASARAGWALCVLCLVAFGAATSAEQDATVRAKLEIAEIVAQYSYRWDSKDC